MSVGQTRSLTQHRGKSSLVLFSPKLITLFCMFRQLGRECYWDHNCESMRLRHQLKYSNFIFRFLVNFHFVRGEWAPDLLLLIWLIKRYNQYCCFGEIKLRQFLMPLPLWSRLMFELSVFICCCQHYCYGSIPYRLL